MIYKINKDVLLEESIGKGLTVAAALGSAAALGAGSIYTNNNVDDMAQLSVNLKREGDFEGSSKIDKQFVNGVTNSAYGAGAVGAIAGGLGYISGLKQSTKPQGRRE